MKLPRLSTVTGPLVIGALLMPLSTMAAESDGRRIEEVIVTAEKRESTVSDTSISITAFGQDRIEDLGLQGADEMINFIPATTRDAYDIRIRGVGRNFRSLGGDPGVATYYNGVYSEDFGIAASEGALYDIERIEVLRGPQGTLYGRNSTRRRAELHLQQAVVRRRRGGDPRHLRQPRLPTSTTATSRARSSPTGWPCGW